MLKKIITTQLFALLLFVSAGNAQAILITYTITGEATNTGATATGTIILDDSLLGTSLNPNTDFFDWTFTWTDPALMTTNTISQATGRFTQSTARFDTLTDGTVTRYALCATVSGSCRGRELGLSLSSSSSFGWLALTEQGFAPSRGTTQISGPVTPATQIPSPAPVALLTAGLLAFGVSRSVSPRK